MAIDIKEYEGKGRKVTLEKGWSDLKAKDPEIVKKRAKVKFDPLKKIFSVPFLNEEYEVDMAGEKIRKADKEASPFTAILILHYLVNASDLEPTGKFISFRELKGGDVYYQAFKRRAIDVIAENFTPELFLDLYRRLGGERVDEGDAGMRFMAFPKIPITVLVWRGNEEIRGSANILFDETAGEHMPTEDLSLICSTIASRLKKMAKWY
jgi:hypothetical protein